MCYELTFKNILKLGKNFLVISILTLGMIGEHSAFAKRRPTNKPEFRARLGLLWGRVDYASSSYATNANTSFYGNQFGGRGEAEAWFNRFSGLRLDAGTMQFQFVDKADGFRGGNVSQDYVGVSIAARYGSGEGPFSKEFAIFVGPSISYYSEIRAYPRRSFFDRIRVPVLGTRIQPRVRLPLGKSFALELSGWYFKPWRVLDSTKSGTLVATTHSAGGVLNFEHRITEGVGLGLGGLYEQNTLEYNYNPKTQSMSFDFMTGHMYVFFWF